MGVFLRNFGGANLELRLPYPGPERANGDLEPHVYLSILLNRRPGGYNPEKLY